MSVRQRRPISSQGENEEETQQGKQYVLQLGKKFYQKILLVLQWLIKGIYDCLWSGIQYTGQFLRYIMKHLTTALVFVILLLGLMHVIWKYVMKRLIFWFVCGSIISYLPGTSYYCTHYSTLNDGNSTMPSLPIHSVVEKTVELAERLSDADVSAPIKLTEIKIALIDLKTSVSFSHLDRNTKDQLLAQIDVITSSVGSTRNEIHKMLAVFNGVLKHLDIYTNNLYRLLTDETEVTSSRSKFPPQLKQYLENIEREIERTIKIASHVHSMLGMVAFFISKDQIFSRQLC